MVVAMVWALFHFFCAAIGVHLSAVVALEFIGPESSSLALALPRWIALAAISLVGFLLSWLELLIYLAFFTLYTSGMFASMAAATGVIWVGRTAAGSLERIGSRAFKTKKME